MVSITAHVVSHSHSSRAGPRQIHWSRPLGIQQATAIALRHRRRELVDESRDVDNLNTCLILQPATRTLPRPSLSLPATLAASATASMQVSHEMTTSQRRLHPALHPNRRILVMISTTDTRPSNPAAKPAAIADTEHPFISNDLAKNRTIGEDVNIMRNDII